MLVEPKEAIAGLQLLACLAKADGKLHPEEKKILTEAWHKVQQLSTLPEDVTIESIFAERARRESYAVAHLNEKCEF